MENKNIETRKLSLRREPVNRINLIFRSREFPKLKRVFESANVRDNAANSNQTFFLRILDSKSMNHGRHYDNSSVLLSLTQKN